MAKAEIILGEVASNELCELDFTLTDSGSTSGTKTFTIDLTKNHMLVIWTNPSSGVHLAVDFIREGVLKENQLHQDKQWSISLSDTTLTLSKTAASVNYKFGTLE